jgi:WXG100 family type VII secretion target
VVLVIIVNGDQIAKTGNNIKEYAHTLQTKIKEIENALDQINVSWQGADAISYLNNMRSKYIVALQKLEERIDTCADYLIKVPNTYETLDESYASKSIGV